MPSLYGAECMGGMWSSLLLLLEPDFCSQFFRSGSWVWGGWSFCIIWSRICFNCSLHAVILSPTELLGIFEKFAQEKALKQRVPGPGLSQKDPERERITCAPVLSGASPHRWSCHLPHGAWSYQEAPSDPGEAAAARPGPSLCCRAGVASRFLVVSPVPGARYGFNSAQSLSRVRLPATPWTAARQASLSITNSHSLLKLMSVESGMPSNHLTLCRPLLLPPSIFPIISSFM